MKKCFTTIIAIIITFSSITASSESDEYKYIGIDFSAVNVMYADESTHDFINVFEKINILMIAEWEKYNFANYLNINIDSKDISTSINNIKKLNDRNFQDYEIDAINVESIIAEYPEIKGKIIVVIAEKLDKAEQKGYFQIVLFDGQTKEIFKTMKVSGKAGGFGLRNYWARAIYNSLRNY